MPPVVDVGSDGLQMLPTQGRLFVSNWDTAIGNTQEAIDDGGAWDMLWCSGTPSPNMFDIMTVVPGSDVGWTLTDNVLRITQRGASGCANVETTNSIEPGTDFYVRFYVRNDDPTALNFHPVTLNCCGDIQAVLWSRFSEQDGYRPGFGFGTDDYPTNRWHPGDPAEPGSDLLPYGVWHRFELHVEFVDDFDVQIHPRIYGPDGELIADESTIVNVDYDPNVAGHSTLEQWYADGNVVSFTDLELASHFGLGTEGSQGADDTCPDGETGCTYWYYAGVEIRDDTWPGPIR